MKNVLLASLIGLVGLVGPAVSAQAQPGRNQINALTVPVVGSGTGGTFTGTMQIQRFATQDNKLVAVGLLTGMVTQVVNGVTTNTAIVRTVVVPATVTNGAPTTTAAPGVTALATCDILNLVLGPLHLDLLGLVVDLNQVVLNITGETGAGNLLGNLLCSITGLLDSPGGLARVLNQILAILQ